MKSSLPTSLSAATVEKVMTKKMGKSRDGNVSLSKSLTLNHQTFLLLYLSLCSDFSISWMSPTFQLSTSILLPLLHLHLLDEIKEVTSPLQAGNLTDEERKVKETHR